VTIETRIDDGLPALTADGRILRQILVNLVSNAVKFTNAGGRVTVAAARRPDGGLAIEVRDTGIGIPPDDIGRVTQPFHQVDRGLNRRYEGTGLGLALVTRFAELHGARFALESEVGKGTTATVIFPAGRVGGVSKEPSRPLPAPALATA
jgi:signal transduction histidine kinase